MPNKAVTLGLNFFHGKRDRLVMSAETEIFLPSVLCNSSAR
jgi:hypothetical protein